ncbi:hypothetical protein QJS66_20640 [Kocuria rhizophila]|nr:hypothetical protein QJS66_20640 [Kocuria rhizophila]
MGAPHPARAPRLTGVRRDARDDVARHHPAVASRARPRPVAPRRSTRSATGPRSRRSRRAPRTASSTRSTECSRAAASVTRRGAPPPPRLRLIGPALRVVPDQSQDDAARPGEGRQLPRERASPRARPPPTPRDDAGTSPPAAVPRRRRRCPRAPRPCVPALARPGGCARAAAARTGPAQRRAAHQPAPHPVSSGCSACADWRRRKSR